MAAFARKNSIEMNARLEKKLESELQRKLARMGGRIEDVVDNLALMEIEILDGASKDIVWQNTHPEMAEAVKQKLSQKLAAAQNEAPTWNWGSAATQFDSDDWGENEEVWEDELGAHAVALNNLCQKKEKQL
jgi:hypothetical protein